MNAKLTLNKNKISVYNDTSTAVFVSTENYSYVYVRPLTPSTKSWTENFNRILGTTS